MHDFIRRFLRAQTRRGARAPLHPNRHSRNPMLMSSIESTDVHTQYGTNSNSTRTPSAINTIAAILVPDVPPPPPPQNFVMPSPPAALYAARAFFVRRIVSGNRMCYNEDGFI